MAFLQQDQPVLVDVRGGNAPALRTRLVCRHRQQERILEQTAASQDPASSTGSASITTSSAPRASFIEQNLGLGFPQLQPQIGMALLQDWQDLRQQIGRDGRNDAEAERAGQEAAAVAGDVDQIARRRQQLRASSHHLGADLGEHNLVTTALHQRDAQKLLQIADLHGQCRLGDRAGVRRTAEMAVFRRRFQVAQLT